MKSEQIPFLHLRASLVGQTIKNLPATQETQVWSLHQEDPLDDQENVKFELKYV